MNLIKNFILGIAFALKRGDEILTTSNKTNVDDGSTIDQKQEKDSVYDDLLKSEVTQEVKNLRYSMYRAYKESKKYKHIGNGISIKVTDQKDLDNIFKKNSELKVILIQENSIIQESILDELNKLGENDGKTSDYDENYLIYIDRNFTSRFKLEKIAKKIVLFELNDDEVLVDFYVSKYPDNILLKNNLPLSEIQRIIKGNIKSDLVTFDSFEFVTINAYNSDDYMHYKFDNVEYESINEFDGNYVLSFKAKKNIFGYDITEEFYSEEQEERYLNKESKNKETFTVDFESVTDKQKMAELDEIKEILKKNK